MGANPEVIQEPLSPDALAARYRELCVDPRFKNLPGKAELDVWGRILMSPASNYHGMLQSRLSQRLQPLGGQAFTEASVVTTAGVLVADVGWGSTDFMRDHGHETPFDRAPELCIEIVSPSNSAKELREKVDAYLGAGAVEVWIVYPDSKRIERSGPAGMLDRTSFSIELAGLFDQGV